MKSYRLARRHREILNGNLLARYTKPRQEQAAQLHDAIARQALALFLALHGSAPLFKKVPRNWLLTDTSVSWVYSGYNRAPMHESDNERRVMLSERLALPAILTSREGHVEIEDEALEERYQSLMALERQHEEDIAKVRAEISCALAGINTTTQLVEQWPEAVPCLPAFMLKDEPTPNLPAPILTDLTHALGLDVSAESAA